jgi:diguanylate cyclase (GGDEF)-like protein
VATRLRACLRNGDTLARFGGDEFAMLLEGVGDPTGARRVAERLLVAFQTPLPIAGRARAVTISVGIALRASPADTPAALLRRADVALYRAKAAGRATYTIFEPGMDA